MVIAGVAVALAVAGGSLERQMRLTATLDQVPPSHGILKIRGPNRSIPSMGLAGKGSE
jgi:hypothetical protein